MPSQPEAQGDILKEFREGTFLSSLDTAACLVDVSANTCCDDDPWHLATRHFPIPW